MKYNPHIHNRQSLRLKGYDYGSEGLYFLTICTYDRNHYFGEIKNGKMTLNAAGKIATECWENIPNHFPHTKLYEYVIMPNHVHGIIEITENRGGVAGGNGALSHHVGSRLIASLRDATTAIPNDTAKPNDTPPQHQNNSTTTSENDKTNNKQNKTPGGATGKCNPMFYQNISRIMRWYKGRCSFEIRKIQPDFKWQSRFHDHIIRKDSDYYRIAEYIIKNPRKWKEDKFYKLDEK